MKTEHADKIKSIKQIKERKVDVAIANKRNKSSGGGDHRGGFGNRNNGGFHKRRFGDNDHGGFHKKRFSEHSDRPSFDHSSGPNMGDSPRFNERSDSYNGFHKIFYRE
ncbi:hypothetical protein FACS1894218_1740 [Bacilli bacterium]|nr:hypothetical protein FACS1894218_1740 [Bacilli bacterium]